MTRRNATCLVALGVVLACAATAADAAKKKHAKPKACPGGRFRVQGAPLVTGFVGADAIVIVGSDVSTASGCDDAKAKIRAKKAATLVTVRWPACNGINGAVVLKAKLTVGSCRTLSGVFKAKKAKINRRFIADVEGAPSFTTGPFATLPLTQATVGPAGGTIAVSDPASPLNALAIEVPPGATDEPITFSIHHAEISGASGLPDQAEPASEMIEIEASGSAEWNAFRFFNRPIKVTLPYVPPVDGEDTVRFYAVGADGTLEAAGFLAQDMGNKTISFFTRTFADTGEPPRVPAAGTPAAAGRIRPHAIRSFNGYVGVGVGRLFHAWMAGGTRINTGFRPSVNGWFIPNYGSYYKASRGGNCFGFVGAAKYYYKKRYSPGLYSNYRDANNTPTWLDDTTAIQFTSRVHNAMIDIWQSYWTGEVNVQRPSSTAVALSYVGAMYVTGVPALLYIQQAVPQAGSNQILYSGAHAIAVYRVDIAAGGDMTFYVYDPNFPGDNGRRIMYSLVRGFAVYGSGTTAATSTFRYNFFTHVGYNVGLSDALLDAIKASADNGFAGDSVFPTIEITNIRGARSGEEVLNKAKGVAIEGTTRNGEHKYITSDNSINVIGNVRGGLAQDPCCRVQNVHIFLSNRRTATGLGIDGSFSFALPIAQGENEFVVLASDKMRPYASWAGFYRNVIESTFSPAALTVTLDWDQDDSDVDLYVKEPDDLVTPKVGDTVYFSHRTGVSASSPYLDLDNTRGFGPEHYIGVDHAATLYTDSTFALNLYGDYLAKVHYYADHDTDPMADQPIDWHVTYRYLAFCPDPCTDPESNGFWVDGSADGNLFTANSGNCCNIDHTGPDWSFGIPIHYQAPNPRDWDIPEPAAVMLP